MHEGVEGQAKVHACVQGGGGEGWHFQLHTKLKSTVHVFCNVLVCRRKIQSFPSIKVFLHNTSGVGKKLPVCINYIYLYTICNNQSCISEKIAYFVQMILYNFPLELGRSDGKSMY